MFGIDLLEEKAFFSFGSRKGLKPVRVWIGRIDEPADLGGTITEPVLSTMVTSLRDGMPYLAHAPFRLSAMLADPYQKLQPFDLDTSEFRQSYAEWRDSWENDENSVWSIGPAEVYRDALRYLMGQRKQ